MVQHSTATYMEALAVFLDTEGLATLAAPRRPSLTVLEGSGITLLVHLTVEMYKSFIGSPSNRK